MMIGNTLRAAGLAAAAVGALWFGAEALAIRDARAALPVFDRYATALAHLQGASSDDRATRDRAWAERQAAMGIEARHAALRKAERDAWFAAIAAAVAGLLVAGIGQIVLNTGRR